MLSATERLGVRRALRELAHWGTRARLAPFEGVMLIAYAWLSGPTGPGERLGTEYGTRRELGPGVIARPADSAGEPILRNDERREEREPDALGTGTGARPPAELASSGGMLSSWSR